MGTTIVKRPERRPAPEPPVGEVVLEPPPEIPAATGQRIQQLMMLLPMLAGSGAMALMFAGARGGVLSYIAGAAFGVSALGMIAAQVFNGGGAPSKSQMAATRREYIRALALQRKRVLYTIERQREAMFYRHPQPDSLWSTVESSRLWERRRVDADFAVVRIGLGPQELATPLVPPQTKSLDTLETLCAAALRKFIQAYAIVPDLPVAMALNGFANVYVRGDIDRARAMTRAMLTQVVAFHAPDDMLVAVCAGLDERRNWEWTKWLPHALHPTRYDALGQLRLVAPSITALEAMLEDVIASRPRFDPSASGPQVSGPHVLVIMDGGDPAGSDHLMTDGGVEGVTVVDLTRIPPRALDRAALVLEIVEPELPHMHWDPTPILAAQMVGQKTPNAPLITPPPPETLPKLRSHTIDGEADIGEPDSVTITEAEAIARQLAPLRLSIASRGEQPLTADMGLGDLLELGDPFEFDPADTWIPRPNRDRLRVPIGLSPQGTPVELDLKESAQDGMGPHGLLIGATGSGKSELLRTLVLALATTHDSETLNFVLVDFKGGATFTKLDRLPHTSAVITNLADELPLVDRMTDAINGELLRRQELLRAAGNYSSLRDYEKARASGAPLSPLPSLLIICDEFSELLSAKPDFIDMFVQIGRLGRSLGVHLLLASQRLEEGRLRGLDTHLSYRIGLRTFSTTESRIVLGSADAYELPRAPGHGFVKFGTEPLGRFRAAYVSGVYHRGQGPKIVEEGGWDGILDYSTQYLAARQDDPEQENPPAEADDEEVGETFLDIVVNRIEGKGTPAHQVWLPPLKEPATMDQLLPGITEEAGSGLIAVGSNMRGALKAVIGVIDRPLEQRRDLYALDVAGSSGHMAVVGGPQSGKSTALRAFITSLALTHTPREVQFYCLDFGGGSLMSLRDLPHVGGAAGRLDVNQVRRSVSEMHTLLLRREQIFTENGIDGMSTYRKLKRQGEYPDDQYGDAFLVIDGWPTIRNDFDDLEDTITDLAIRGLSYGIHVAISASRWMDLRSQLRDMLGTKVELRLGDPSDSMIARRAAINVPDQSPGRGLTTDQHHMLIALPRIDGDQDPESLAEGVAAMAKRSKAAWPGVGAPPVRLLPPEYPYLQLPPARETRENGISIGIAESNLRPVFLDFKNEPHLLMFGDSESGKSAFLRALATSITAAYTPDEARVMLVDFRRSLLGVVETEHLIGYGTSAAMTESMMADTSEVMQRRLPGPDITAEQLRARNWWTGPELFLLIDDYDLVATGGKNPLGPMLEYLAQGRDIGLHVIVTRRSGGASRALYDPIIQRLRDLSSPGIMLSGSREEGVLLGNVRPSALPPGRGWLITRKRGTEMVQLAWMPPKD